MCDVCESAVGTMYVCFISSTAFSSSSFFRLTGHARPAMNVPGPAFGPRGFVNESDDARMLDNSV
jgi:hypothetical protein